MSNEDFNAEILAEKLSKLNNSQQSIESLSQWCVSHRKKAKQIVETWDNLFNSSQKEKRVSFLYLANDILQNSRRKGSEFVNEFWKVLPAALKHVYGNGDEHGKRVVTRLVNIWEERKVFGSRGYGLKDEMLGIIQKKDEALGKDPPPPSVSNGKSSNPIKIVKKDASSLRIKLVIGGLPEKILSAFQSVYEESSSEDAALEKCINAAKNMGKIEEEAQKSLIQGNLEGSVLVDGLQDQEIVVIQCIHKLENAEATRASLVAQLKEALHDQESKLELIHAQLQVARGLVEQSNNLRIRLTSSSSVPGVPSNSTTIPISFSEIPILGEQSLPTIQPKTTPTIPGVPPNSTTIPTSFPEIPRLGDQSLPAVQPNTTPAPPPPLPQPTMTSFPSLKGSDGESKKAAVAAMAAKLAASTSSAQMLSSVLSSLVAEEAAASMNVGQKPSGFTAGLPIFPPEKKPKLEKPMAVSEVSTNSDISGPMYFTPQSMNNVPPPPSMAAQPNHMQAPFASPPPPPALAATVPALSSANPTTNQYVQPSGLMTMPYGYGSNSLPPPPPLPSQVALPLARPLHQPPQQPQHEQPQQQSGSGTGGYYRPPGIVFFGQSHQSTTSSVPRQ